MNFSPEDIERAKEIEKKRMEVLYKLPHEERKFEIGDPAFHLIRDDLPWLLDFLLPPTPEEQEFIDSVRRSK